VRRVLRLFNRDEHPFDPAVTAASPVVDELQPARLQGSGRAGRR
jgi:hypothetical protein